ncbi:MAG: hypothetical protein ICV54_18300 [Nostoc sp. C3-bin3]|nr:hypothetical protein [Nostoc sp. C3-bin3]
MTSIKLKKMMGIQEAIKIIELNYGKHNIIKAEYYESLGEEDLSPYWEFIALRNNGESDRFFLYHFLLNCHSHEVQGICGFYHKDPLVCPECGNEKFEKIGPEVMAETLKFCSAEESSELLRMGWNVHDHKYWDKVKICSKAIQEADILKFKSCATKEERELLVSGWNENHLWRVSLTVDVERLNACATEEDRKALSSQWDADYGDAVWLEFYDKFYVKGYDIDYQ